MSRIGKAPIPLPDGVEFKYDHGVVIVKGPKGELTQRVPREMIVEVGDGVIQVSRPTESGQHRSLHGLTRTLIANMVTGVTAGFEKRLDIVGVGYRASVKGKDLELLVGYSHPVVIEPPEHIEFETPQPTVVLVRGIDKQVVGEIAAKVRSTRPPEPYKGKGVRYAGEYVQRKVGKRA
jgi:large subunit ribosomal protein L6